MFYLCNALKYVHLSDDCFLFKVDILRSREFWKTCFPE